MAQNKPKPRSCRPWSDKEVAFLVSYMDWCLHHGQNFKKGVEKALGDNMSTERSLSAVQNKLLTCLVYKREKGSMKDFTKEGTACLDLGSMRSQITSEMASQRKRLGLEPLDMTDTLPNTIAGDATTIPSDDSVDDEYLKRSRTCNASGGRKTYCEYLNEDSDSGRSTQSDFTIGTPKKPVGKKPKVVLRLSMAPKPATQAPAKTNSPSADASHGHEVSSETPQTGTAMPLVHKRAGADDVNELLSNGESPQENIADKVSSSPRKRQKCYKDKPPAGMNGAISSPTISAFSNTPDTPGRARTCPETPQRESPRAVLEKRRSQSHPTQPSKHDVSASRPAYKEAMKQQQEDTRKQMEVMKQQYEYTMRQLEVMRQQQEVLRQQQEETNSILFQLYKEWDPSGRKASSEFEQRMKLIARTMQKNPGTLADRILDDLASLSHSNEKFRKTFHSLVGYADDRFFPVVPSSNDLDYAWACIRRGVRDAVVYEYPADLQLPNGAETGYIASEINSILKDGGTPLDPAAYMQELEGQLGSMHTVQSLLSALFFSWLFARPDAFFEGFYSTKELKMFEATLLSDGPSTVQRIDKTGASLMLNDEDDETQKSKLTTQLTTLHHNLLTALSTTLPSAPGLDPANAPHAWLTEASNLKRTLLLSPKDYRIHFPLPDTAFDPSWMKPEDVHGIPLKDAETVGKRVVMCIFPALVQIEAGPFVENVKVEELLVVNKRFFPTPAERKAFEPRTVVSKAFVLLG